MDDEDIVVSIYGRLKDDQAPFSLVALPDAQFYTEQSWGGRNYMFRAQTQWVVDNQDRMNIAHTVQLGDCTQNGDNGGNDIEWKRADTTMSILENPITTRIPDGMSYTMCVGNHDQTPMFDPNGTTHFFNKYFGVDRFSGRYYWGGNYSDNADNSYQLFSKNGLDFIVISVEFDEAANPLVLDWADALLKHHSKRSAIIVGHYFLDKDGNFSAQGEATYEALKDNPNLFLMLSGHQGGEAVRRNTFQGRTVYAMLSNYQWRSKGGSGMLRVMKIDPSKRSMEVATYSPWLDQYERDDNSQFKLEDLNIESTASPFTLIKKEILKEGEFDFTWTGLTTDTVYEWYATVTDGKDTIVGPINEINTHVESSLPHLTVSETDICEGDQVVLKAHGGQLYNFYVNNERVTPTSRQNVLALTNLKHGDEIEVLSHNGCFPSVSRPIYMSVTGRPEIQVSGSDTNLAICSGDTIWVSAKGAEEIEYHLNDKLLHRGPETKVELHLSDQLTVTGSNECFSTVESLVYDIKELPYAEIRQVDDILHSNHPMGNQWFFNNELLTDETGPFLQPKENGDYTLMVTNEFGCVGNLSTPFKYSTSGIRDASGRIGFEIYPNPFSDFIRIKAAQSFKDVRVEVFDATGHQVLGITRDFGENGSSQWLTINSGTHDLKAGVYFIRVSTETSAFSGRVVSVYR